MSGESAISASVRRDHTDSPDDPGIWHNGNFLYLWAGQSVSLVGSAVSYIALPLVGVIVLKLDALQVGALASAGALPKATLSPFLGTVADKIPRRLLCAICDIIRGILIGSVPVTATLGVLSYWQLLTVNAVVIPLTALFDVAHQAFLPELVPERLLSSGNSKLEASQAAADVSGPGIAAWLMGLGGPATAVIADAISYGLSAALLVRVRLTRAKEPQRQAPAFANGKRLERGVPSRVRGFLRYTREGFTGLWRDPVLRSVSISYAALALFAQVQMAVYMLFLVRSVHFSATTIGVVFTIGGAFGFVAAVVSGRIAGHLGTGRLIVAGQLIMVAGGVLLACIGGSTLRAAATMLAGETCFGVGLSFYGVGNRTLIQTRTANQMRGRVIGSSRVLSGWCVAAAGFLGGSIGAAVGLRGTLITGAVGMVLAVSLVLRPQVWTAGDNSRKVGDGQGLQ